MVLEMTHTVPSTLGSLNTSKRHSSHQKSNGRGGGGWTLDSRVGRMAGSGFQSPPTFVEVGVDWIVKDMGGN